MGSSELLIVLALLVPLVINVVALVELFRRDKRAFEAAGVSRVMWLVIILVSIFLCPLGFLGSLFYLFVEAPKVRSQEKLGGGPGFPGGTGNFPPY